MASVEKDKAPAGFHYIYVKWITRKGKRVFPPNGLKVWRLKVREGERRLTQTNTSTT